LSRVELGAVLYVGTPESKNLAKVCLKSAYLTIWAREVKKLLLAKVKKTSFSRERNLDSGIFRILGSELIAGYEVGVD